MSAPFLPGCRLLVAAALLLWTLLAAGPAVARTALELDARQQPVPLRDWGDSWIDRSGTLQPEQVWTGPAAWQSTADNAVYKLAPGEVLWFRFVVPPAPDAERWYLRVVYPGVNRVTLYRHDATGGWVQQTAGDMLPVADWPLPHRFPMLPLAVSAEEPRNYLLRVENAPNFSAPLDFVSEGFVIRQEQRASLVLGMYFGLATLVSLLGIVGALWLRDAAYSLLALSVALMGLTQASLTGMAGLHLWPHWPWWNDMAPQVLPVVGAASSLWFATSVVSLRARSRRLYLVVMGAAALSLPVAAAILHADVSSRSALIVSYAMLAMVATVGLLGWAAWRGDRYAPWLLLASTPVMAGALFPLARAASLTPVSFWTAHAMQLGIAIELPMLLVLLAIRSQHRREHIRRIQGLERIDPATGLLNAQVFQERLVRLINRSQRLKLRSAILLVDIANIEQMKRDFGSEAMRELILRVAGRLLAGSREIDTVARLSHHRFGVLLEGPLKADEVAEAAPRIVARCLMPFKNRPLEWAARVRVAQALIPMDGHDPAQLIGQLELLLATAPDDGRRSVFVLSRPMPLGSRAGELTS
ncbi:MAG: sensor domain-containing diguanylate cyclase [Ramlibacter sp.]